MADRTKPQIYINRLQKICRAYVDRLDNGGSDIYIQKILAMIILGISDYDYQMKLFNNWPTYLEDYENSQEIIEQRYPQTLCDEFVRLKFESTVKILDVACGGGNVANILKNHGYTNIDGLDQAQVMLDTAQKKQLYRNVFCCQIKPEEILPIADGSYDVLLCSAGLFPGSIDLRAFKELIRLVKIGGTLIWNIDCIFGNLKLHDKIIGELVEYGIWCEVQPAKKVAVVFADEYAFIHVMKRLK